VLPDAPRVRQLCRYDLGRTAGDALPVTRKILITGAAGFIGSFLFRKLLEHGWEVVGIDNLNDIKTLS
jgi:hypothetical protein